MEKRRKNYILIAITIAIIVIVLTFFIVFLNPFWNLEYVNSQIGFGFNPPKDWTLRGVDEGTVYYEYYDEENYSRELEFIVHVGLNNMVNYTAESYYEDVLQNEALNDPENVSVISFGERTVNGMKAYEIIFIVNDYYSSGPFLDSEWYDQQAKLIFLESNNKIVLIEYRTLPFLYEKYDPIIEESINSLIIV